MYFIEHWVAYKENLLKKNQLESSSAGAIPPRSSNQWKNWKIRKDIFLQTNNWLGFQFLLHVRAQELEEPYAKDDKEEDVLISLLWDQNQLCITASLTKLAFGHNLTIRFAYKMGKKNITIDAYDKNDLCSFKLSD